MFHDKLAYILLQYALFMWQEFGVANRKPLSTIHKQRAERLKKLWAESKRERKISQRDINADIGWSAGAFTQYLNGKIPINFAAAVKICDALGVPVTALMPEETPESIADQKRFVENLLICT